ncbi:MAG: glutamine synthetase [Calditrichaeota bacterium]|nr:MAG: glutamine synthetase [Calditrichota bacterium]MBL1205641.1 glutamine synthetase [Calditrichota bacterium]NOG45469.1 glutamine synthetase [Calditrichota bacterium]
MAYVKGMLSLDQLKSRVKSEDIETVLVVFTDLYGRFMGKRYDADFFVKQVVKSGAHACDYLFTVDMEMNPVAGYSFANWESGYGDVHLVPDFATLRVASWLEKSALIICDVHNEKTHKLEPINPRSILREQIKRTEKAGYVPMAGSELEYYIFENSFREASEKKYTDLKAAGWYIEDYHILQGTREENFNALARRHLKNSGVPVENSKGEWGLGQHELNVRYADILTMADRHSVYKQCLKEVADKLGISVTFMAKFSEDQAGSSCHLHLSLEKAGNNIFPGKLSAGPVKCSQEFLWFLGGWIKHVPDVMVFYAPTVNSYKRYQSGSWAPTRLGWSYDNRTAGFRVVGSGKSLRIECRIPGADCNPYLAFAAALACGLDGIENKIDPPPIFEGDIYNAAKIDHVPKTLAHAITLFEKSDFVKSNFGETVQKHYTHFFKSEQADFDNAVTDWERKRYFERI